MRLLEHPQPYPAYVLFCDFAGDVFETFFVDFVAIGMVPRLGYGAYRAWPKPCALNVKSSSKPAQVGGVSTASIVIRHIAPNVRA